MKNKIIGIVILLMLFISKTSFCTPDPIPNSCFNPVIGYQNGFGLNNPIYRPTFDLNLHFFLFDIGYSLNNFYGSTGYVGIALLVSELQIQYGYGFTKNTNSIRIRSDLPLNDLYLITKRQLPEFITDKFSVGVFYEHKFYGSDKSFYGISFSYQILSLIRDYNRNRLTKLN